MNESGVRADCINIGNSLVNFSDKKNAKQNSPFTFTVHTHILDPNYLERQEVQVIHLNNQKPIRISCLLLLIDVKTASIRSKI